jgi:hypothetical protein
MVGVSVPPAEVEGSGREPGSFSLIGSDVGCFEMLAFVNLASREGV